MLQTMVGSIPNKWCFTKRANICVRATVLSEKKHQGVHKHVVVAAFRSYIALWHLYKKNICRACAPYIKSAAKAYCGAIFEIVFHIRCVWSALYDFNSCLRMICKIDCKNLRADLEIIVYSLVDIKRIQIIAFELQARNNHSNPTLSKLLSILRFQIGAQIYN